MHTILLIQSSRLDTRTWTDFDTLRECLNAIIKMFENFIFTKSRHQLHTYELSQVYDFLDHLTDISAMVFNKDSGEYMPRSRAWIKQQLYEMMRDQCQISSDGQSFMVPAS